MNIAGVAKRVVRADLQYVFGRFRAVRATYSGVRRALEAPGRVRQGRYLANDRHPTLFPDADVSSVVRAIRDEAVFVGLNLPDGAVAEIKEFALAEPLHAIYDPTGPTFRYSDVSDGKAADGRPIPVGGIRDPARCPAVKRVINDPVLRAIVRGYLGHEPRKIITILDWSFGSSMSDQDRRRLKHHVIDYHYDVGGYNFVYASFYITDTDRHSGAHVMMKRSHNKKPLRMLLGSARASQEEVYKRFGRENEITIEGPAGTGFVQDTSCFHRASPPTCGDRLMLAVRFIN
jgi:hypothetical protein